MKSEQNEWVKCNKLNALQSQEIIALNDRIKKLEDAGDELLWALCPASESMMTERESDALKLWNKAKEAKP